MRMIAAILDCPFRLSIFPEDSEEDEKLVEHVGAGTQKNRRKQKAEDERDMTIGELYEIHEELKELEEESAEEGSAEPDKTETAKDDGEQEKEHLAKEEKEELRSGGIFLRRAHRGEGVKKPEKPKEEKKKPAKEVITPDSEDFEPVIKHNDLEEDLSVGEMNPYTGREYQTNSVRMHPSRIGYVQVYDRRLHQWTDMTEWAFLGYQERKKALLGKEYEPPIYLD